jgi:hypothetical protein
VPHAGPLATDCTRCRARSGPVLDQRAGEPGARVGGAHAVRAELDVGCKAAPHEGVAVDRRAAGAQTFGVTLDPTRTVILIPVAPSVPGGSTPDTAGDFTVSTQPPLDVPVQYASGEAIVFNAIATDSYQVTVTRGASTCVPASHPAAVAADGSVELRTLPGFWTVGPAMVCP